MNKILSLVAVSAMLSLTVACSSKQATEEVASEPMIEQTASVEEAAPAPMQEEVAAPAYDNSGNLGASSSGLGH